MKTEPIGDNQAFTEARGRGSHLYSISPPEGFKGHLASSRVSFVNNNTIQGTRQ